MEIKQEIKTEFRKFYMKLYTKKDDPGREEHAIPDEYFKELEEEEKVKMEEEISTSQMKESTSNLNRNKSPAAGGLTSEFALEIISFSIDMNMKCIFQILHLCFVHVNK